MSTDLSNLVKATRDSSVALSDLLPMYRAAIGHADFKVHHFAIDSMLLRASIAHPNEWAGFLNQLEDDEEYIRTVAWLGRTIEPVKGTRKVLNSADAVEKRRVVLWLIDSFPDSHVHQHAEATLNQPGDEDTYDVGKSHWFKKIVESPEDVQILSNAAHFFLSREPELSRQCLLICAELEPDFQQWRRRLAKLGQTEGGNLGSGKGGNLGLGRE